MLFKIDYLSPPLQATGSILQYAVCIEKQISFHHFGKSVKEISWFPCCPWSEQASW